MTDSRMQNTDAASRYVWGSQGKQRTIDDRNLSNQRKLKNVWECIPAFKVQGGKHIAVFWIYILPTRVPQTPSLPPRCTPGTSSPKAKVTLDPISFVKCTSYTIQTRQASRACVSSPPP